MAPKKAPKNTNKNQPESSKQGKEHRTKEEQPQPWRDEAEARVRRNRQYSMKDIKVFEIDINATEEEFMAFTKARVNHMRGVATTFVQGSPVTPPFIKGFVTRHIVRVTDKQGGGDRPYAELLFQEYNLYFTAFRARTRESDALDATGWFAFKDADMPSFMKFERINYTVSYNKSSQVVQLGFGVKKDILQKVLGYNTANRLDKSPERELALHTTPYMMSELVRLGKALEEVVDLIRRKERGPLTNPLFNCWGNISRVALSYELCQDKSILENAAAAYKLDLISQGSTKDYSISKLVGGDGYLRVLLYSEEEVEALLRKRQKDSPPTRVLILKILTGQGQNLHISEVEKQLSEKCGKYGKVTGFLVDQAQNILVQYSHPRGASEAKLFLDGSVVGGHILDARFSNDKRFFLLKESFKGKKVEDQPQSSSNVEFLGKQIPSTIQDPTDATAQKLILKHKSNNEIPPSYQDSNAPVEKDTFQGSSTKVEPSETQIALSDHFPRAADDNVRFGKQSVEQESEEAAHLEELHLLACIVRSVPSTPSEQITISSALRRRLGKILPPLRSEYYNSHDGRLADLLASHRKLFVVEGDLIHLRQGAHQIISAKLAVAKVNIALSSRTTDSPKNRINLGNVQRQIPAALPSYSKQVRSNPYFSII